MKKNKFKEHLKKKINQAAFNDLLKRKDSHSKVDHINFKNFEAQAYIKSYKFKTVDKQLLFKLRTRMTNVKANFKTMHENIHCDLCDEEVLQSDAHLLDCKTIIEKCPTLANDMDTEYEDIFSDIEKQLKTTQIYKEIFETKILLDEQADLLKHSN